MCDIKLWLDVVISTKIFMSNSRRRIIFIDIVFEKSQKHLLSHMHEIAMKIDSQQNSAKIRRISKGNYSVLYLVSMTTFLFLILLVSNVVVFVGMQPHKFDAKNQVMLP